jgi:hypothetical protein
MYSMMMMVRILLLLIVLSPITFVMSQSVISKDTVKNNKEFDNQEVKTTVIDGDTVLMVDLKPITILPPLEFTSKRQFNRYTRLVLYVKKVYPYSQLVSRQLDTIHANLAQYKTEKEKKRYITQKEKELKQQFEGQLRSLTFTQGKILMKLIDRETGVTTFEIVKELKGSLNAFFWQSVARLFGSSLKLEYDPKGDDIMIEDIVVRIENGEL